MLLASSSHRRSSGVDSRGVAAVLFAVFVGPFVVAVFAAQPEESARRILQETGVEGGVVVHLGCGDGQLTAALRANERYVVHGLDSSEENVRQARKFIQAMGEYGPVSVSRWSGGRLPYADNLANLIVAMNGQAASSSEILRVLAPGGAAYVQTGDAWDKTVKPRPEEMDEWTHWLHAADGNAVARDRLVGPPERMQWAAAPLWQRHHNTVPSTMAMVSSNGRLFYISDEAPAGYDASLPDKWFLVARDAFNGLLLWKRPIAQWGWREWNTQWEGRFDEPPHLQKRVVAAGDRLFATLNFNAPLTALDAATGETLRTYEGTDNTDEVLYLDGLLVLSLNEERRKPSDEDKSPVMKSVCAVDADSGRMLWKRGDYAGLHAKYDASQPFGRLEMAAGDDGVFFADQNDLVCLDLKTGRQRWRIPRPEFQEKLVMYNIPMSDQCVLVYQDGVVLFAQPEMVRNRSWHTLPGTLHAFSAQDGRSLWKHQYGGWAHNWQPDVFAIDGLVWVHEHIDVPFPGHEVTDKSNVDYAVIGLDLKTGELKRRFSTFKTNNVDHHHRCYRGKATERFLLPSRRGVEFLDLETEENLLHHWARGACLHGIVPCNGLLYLTPHPCKCYIETKLNGYWALAPKAERPEGEENAVAVFERGSAYGDVRKSAPAAEASGQWPTFRRDALRSAAAATPLAEQLKFAWRASVGGPISPPVISGGRVFVAAMDQHRVVAFDAKSGRLEWDYVVGGRVDSPPTVYSGCVLFGSSDGWAYCLTESDGRLVWRMRAAPAERLVGAYDQLESAWPVHGSILVQNGVAYLSAGRSSYLDGGIRLYAVDPIRGDVLERRTLYSPDPVTGEMHLPTFDRKVIPGVLSDILVSDGKAVFMRQEPVFGEAAGETSHVFSTAGFRDGAWFDRTFWTMGAVSKAMLLAFDKQMIFGAAPFAGGKSMPKFYHADGGSALFAQPRTPARPRNSADGAGKRSGGKSVNRPRWMTQVPIRVTAMVLAGPALLAAGTPAVADPRDPLAAVEGRQGGQLWRLAAEDGDKIGELDLDSPPVFDGMAVAEGRLFVAAANGELVCFAAPSSAASDGKEGRGGN